MNKKSIRHKMSYQCEIKLKNPVTSLCMMPDGETLLLGCKPGIHMFILPSGSCKDIIRLNDWYEIHSMKVSCDGKHLFISHNFRNVAVVSLEKKQVIFHKTSSFYDTHMWAEDAGENEIIYSESLSSVARWNYVTQQRMGHYRFEKMCDAPVFHRERQYLIAMTEKKLIVHSTRTNQIMCTTTLDDGRVFRKMTRLDEDTIICNIGGCFLSLFSCAKLMMITGEKLINHEPEKTAVFADGHHVIDVYQKNKFRVYDIRRTALLLDSHAPLEGTDALLISPSGKYVIFSFNNTVSVIKITPAFGFIVSTFYLKENGVEKEFRLLSSGIITNEEGRIVSHVDDF